MTRIWRHVLMFVFDGADLAKKLDNISPLITQTTNNQEIFKGDFWFLSGTTLEALWKEEVAYIGIVKIAQSLNPGKSIEDLMKTFL
eukprot:2828108-Ditylum_brightwellii.AAC.1